MKKVIIYSTFCLILISNFVSAQDWSPWITVYKDGDESLASSQVVQISYKLAKCESGNLVGYGHYKIRNTKSTPGCWLNFSFDFAGCNNSGTESVMVDLGKLEIYNLGMHFFGNKVTRDFYNVRPPNGKCIKSNDKSNTNEIVFPKGERANYFTIKKRLELKINKLTQSSLKSDFNSRFRKIISDTDDDLSKEEYVTRRKKLEILEKEIDQIQKGN